MYLLVTIITNVKQEKNALVLKKLNKKRVFQYLITKEDLNQFTSNQSVLYLQICKCFS